MADSFGFGFNGGFQHRGVDAFGKDHALRIAAGGVVELAGQFAFLSHQFFQMLPIGFPVGDLFACHAAFHGCFGHCHGDFGDEARVNGLRDEVVGTEAEVVDVVYFVHHIGYGLFGK